MCLLTVQSSRLLIERFNRIIDRLKVLEDGDQFGDDKKTLNLVSCIGDTQIAACTTHRGESANEPAKSGGGHEGDIAQIDNDIRLALFDQLMTCFVQFFCIRTAHHIPSQFDHDTVIPLGYFKTHRRSPHWFSVCWYKKITRRC